ncbi:MAG: polyprenyl synthetase family protein [Bacteroidota bacterium]
MTEYSHEFQSVVLEASSFASTAMIEAEIVEAIEDSQGAVRDICFHILNAGGKRVRPLLVWYSGLMFGPESEALKRTAVAVELIHMASLIHDDLIDGAELRRNRPTVQKQWGNHRAVLGGDYLFAKAFGVLADSGLVKPLGIMVRAIQDMCQGEILQEGDQFNSKVSLERYYDRITKKTAVLLEASCKAGALVSGATELEAASIGLFGLNLGLAFQIIDDILDLCGDESKMGKPKYTDLIKGNLTLPIILLMEVPLYREWLMEKFKAENLNLGVLREIEAAIKEGGIMRRAFAVGVSHLEEARIRLKSFAESPAREFLENLTYMLQARAN